MEKTVWFEPLTDNVASVLASGRFPTEDKKKWDSYMEDTEHDRVLGIIAFPCADIELEVWTANGGEPTEATNEDNEIYLDYAVCVKGTYNGEEWWELDGYAGQCEVDFTAENWRELLEADMCEALEGYARVHGRSLTELNDFERTFV